jgi:hypothetical protein
MKTTLEVFSLPSTTQCNEIWSKTLFPMANPTGILPLPCMAALVPSNLAL